MTTLREIDIARCYDSRWDRHYAAAKLRSDPLYQALAGALADSALPLLDIGCGIGLAAHFLRSRGIAVPVHGLDYDARKITAAQRAASRGGLQLVSFSRHDARQGLPDHCGNVCILDILQFFTPSDQEALLREAAARVAPGGVLLIRSGLRDDSLRFRVTIAGDLLARATLWMKAAPVHYPSEGDFRRALAPHGEVAIAPLWGRTPFNNHWIVMRRPV